MTDLLTGDLSDGDTAAPGRGGGGECSEGEGAGRVQVDPGLQRCEKVAGWARRSVKWHGGREGMGGGPSAAAAMQERVACKLRI